MRVILKDHGGFVDIFLSPDVDGRPIGHIKYAHGWHQDISFGGFRLEQKDIYSAMMNLAPAYRNKGIGTMAYKQFIQLMKSHGERRIYGIPKSPKSRRFMHRLGFTRVELPSTMKQDIYELDI